MSEAVVIRHEPPQVRTELSSAREMDGVERSKIGGDQQSGRVQDAVADTQQIHDRKHLPASSNRVRPNGKQRANHLCLGERT